MTVSSNVSQSSKTQQSRQIKYLRSRCARLAKRIAKLKELNQRETAAKQQALRAADDREIENKILAAKLQQVQCESESQNNDTLRKFCNERGICNHTFGARMIALCVNLARNLSFRSIPKTMALVFEALGLSVKVPSHDSIRHWCKRVGLSQLKRPKHAHKDWLWIVDHSNQIGQEKVLVILGISASKLPPPDETLSLDQLEVLAIVPAKSWKRDDVRRVYREVAEHCGTPRFVVCDGAVELRETVDILEKPGRNVVVLRDFKHFAANRFEKLVGRTERFKSFCKQMGQTRCQVQQTELAHLTPPSLKTKARFMNITPIVRWATLALFVLDHPQVEATANVDTSRLEDKLGWAREYRDEIVAWSRCCELIETSLHWINTQGRCRQRGDRFEKYLSSKGDWSNGIPCRQLRSQLIEFVRQSACQLKAGERAWLSSESIESVFGLYKRREGQHSRSSFTGLVVSLPTMLRAWTAAEIRKSLKHVSNRDIHIWTEANIGSTVASLRAKAYKELAKSDRNFSAAA
jgi:hypothetical protein